MPSPVVQWGDPRQYLNRRDRGKRETALGLGKWWRWGMGRVTSGLRRPLPTRKTDWRAAGSLALPGFEGRVSDGHSRSELRTQNHSMAPTRDMEAGLSVQWLRRDRVGDREAACQAHGHYHARMEQDPFPGSSSMPSLPLPCPHMYRCKQAHSTHSADMHTNGLHTCTQDSPVYIHTHEWPHVPHMYSDAHVSMHTAHITPCLGRKSLSIRAFSILLVAAAWGDECTGEQEWPVGGTVHQTRAG